MGCDDHRLNLSSPRLGNDTESAPLACVLGKGAGRSPVPRRKTTARGAAVFQHNDGRPASPPGSPQRTDPLL